MTPDLRGQLFHTYTTESRHEPSAEETARGVLAGRLRLYPHPEVEIPAEPDWSEDPLGDANWRFQLHSLIWLDRLRQAGRELGDQEMLERYVTLLRSWVQHNPQDDPPSDYSWFDMAVGLRAVVLAFAVDHLGAEPWLLEAVRAHGEHLADPANYEHRGNHGLHQDLGLLVAAQILGQRSWTALARQRLLTMFEDAIDSEGVCREGCIDYQYRNYRWYQEALVRLRAAGVADVGAMAERLALMPGFLAHATSPSGKYALLGDTVDHPAAAVPGTAADWPRDATLAPAERVRRYAAGYLFARRRWTSAESDPDNAYLTQRFGPGRSTAVHGHEDAGSVTLDAFGETLLRDSGLYAYESGDERLYFRGRSSHNVVDVPGRKYYPSAAADMVAYEADDTHVFSTVKVVALQGVVWHRSMLWLPEQSALVLDDRVRLHGPDTVLQRWQLPEGAHVETLAGGAVVQVRVQSGATLRFQQAAAPQGVRVVTGSTNPVEGWFSGEYRTRVPAPSLAFADEGDSVRFTTVITYAGPGAPVPTVVDLRRLGTSASGVLSHGGRFTLSSTSSSHRGGLA